MNTKVSVIIPIYNVEPYLRQCLDSVVNQSYKNLEIILIDDGSPDNCGVICDEYAQQDERIIVIHKENGGLSAARNDGIAVSTGYWIAFVDSDDWCETDYYENILKRIGNNMSDVICAGEIIYEKPCSRWKKCAFESDFSYHTKKDLEELQVKVLANKKSLRSLGGPWDKLYRREFIKEQGLVFDTTDKAWEDIWFNFLVFERAKMVEGYLVGGYHYRIRTTSITKGYNPLRPQIDYEFLSKLQKHIKKNEESDMIISAIHAWTIKLIKNTLDLYYFNTKSTLDKRTMKKEIRAMKRLTYYHEAINEKHNPYLSWKQQIFKWFLKLPWIEPLQILYTLNEILKAKAYLKDNRNRKEIPR